MNTPAASESSTAGIPKFFAPGATGWEDISSATLPGMDETKKREITETRRRALLAIRDALLSSLQMQHVVVLAGSGTSLGASVNGPTMWDLWDYCVNSNPGTGNRKRLVTVAAESVITRIGYETAKEGENIEGLLSRCEAFLQINDDADATTFVKDSKAIILKKCSEFIKLDDTEQLAAHRTFLHRLSRRRIRDSRLKVFTTNYDLCFEVAAGKQGLVVIDGFSFTLPRVFDPRFFSYDIVRRLRSGEDLGNYLEGVFQLYKLHGSVNWSRNNHGDVHIEPNPTPEAVCLIYPARGKYQQSFLQPHLELVSQYLAALREPNTCLVVAGFGFNDDHFAEPILAAVRTNPHLRLVIANFAAEDLVTGRKSGSLYWKTFFDLSKGGADIWLLNASFQDFAQLIPDLKSLTPAQKLAREIKNLAED